MCGRYTLKTSRKAILDEFSVILPDELLPHFNIAPTQDIAVITNDDRQHVKMFHWGLIPSWADDPAIGNRMINARAETLAEKPSFRTALKKRRCLILADGFYEWRKNDDGTKTPMYIRLIDREVFAFAGLWELWNKGPEPVHSCTIITTTPNKLMTGIHDRMPVILPHNAYDAWLSPNETENLTALLTPYPSDEMEAYAVSRLVNTPRNDSPDCIKAA